jgi:hypothetical protein
VRLCKPTRDDFAGFNYFPVPAGAGVILHDATFEVSDHGASPIFSDGSTTGLSVTDRHLSAVVGDVPHYGASWTSVCSKLTTLAPVHVFLRNGTQNDLSA